MSISRRSLAEKSWIWPKHKTPEKYKLYQYKTEPHGQQRVEIDADHVVDLREPGVERFFTLLREAIDG